jgi:arylsulfatase A-like enzyme
VQFAQGCAGAYEAPGGYKGTHGYDPQRPEMAASLLVRAPGFPPGRLVDVRLVDIAPTIADWLGLALADVDGVSLRTCVADSRTSARDAVERDASESGARPTLRCRR